MKFPITDQFLWDVFNAMSQTEDALRLLIHPPRTWRQVFWSADSPIYQKYYKSLNSRKFAQLIYRLKKNNFIKVRNLEGHAAIMLTKKGFNKIIDTRFIGEKSSKQKRKDGKWIMIMFDIPEKYRKLRHLLRDILRNLGYKLFQQSVWVTPYDVSEKTEMLLQLHSLDAFVKTFLIEEII